MTGAAHTSQRIVVVGGGVAGLSIAVRLAQSGLPVTLLEAARIGYAASTRNQGWLHSGAWFAPGQIDLARMCHESFKQTLRFCPDCLEPQCESMAYLFSEPDTDVARWKQAWEKAEIPYEEFLLSEIFEDDSQVDLSQIQHAYRLPDRAVRWNLVLERLAATAENANAEIRTETPVDRLLVNEGSVQGVVTGSGEEIFARMVILAGNAEGSSLWPGSGSPLVGEQSEFTNVVLKSHLLALQPEVSRAPFCVVDANGFNHVPHLQTSVFGSNDWQVVTSTIDKHTEPERIKALWNQVARFFPQLNRDEFEVVEWAGTTVQSMHAEQIEPGAAPLPTVIDHQHESPCTENLISVFTGRATLWAHVAEQTRELVLEKIETEAPRTAVPPWESTDGV